MTPVEIEALTPADLGAELGLGDAAWIHRPFLSRVRNAVADAARRWPEEAAQNPHGLAHDIASSEDWALGNGGEDWHWEKAYALSKILLDSYTPEEA